MKETNMDDDKQITTVIIPAAPGFLALEAWYDKYFSYPIIAWKIREGKIPVPITIRGELGGRTGVLSPDGSVFYGRERFRNADEWFSHMEKE
jgi:hypothetical protein